ncbi:MAG TPA: NAD-dependent epimerase/dehydratase family protein, partial [Oxalicibacterium sp.]|nr:NAD-dependent epimerase/dehydratase family protein [Oxalicibacterium sp.]
PINPYGKSKWMIEQLLPDYEKAHGMRHISLRYFNAAGADPDGMLGEQHVPETHLIPLALRAAMGQVNHFTLYGDDYDTADGSCIRDYIHVADLCAAHLLAIRHLRAGKESDRFNLGNGNGYSVREVLRTVERIVGKPCDVRIAARRIGDPGTLVADAAKARALLGWRPRYTSLEDIVRHTFHWEATQQERFAQVSV